MEPALEAVLLEAENKVIRLQSNLLIEQTKTLVEFQRQLDGLNTRIAALEAAQRG